MEQGRFAGSGWPDDGEKLAALHFQVYPPERLHIHLADSVNLAQILDLDDGRLTHTRGPRSGPGARRASRGRAPRARRPRARSRLQPATTPDPPRVGTKPER